MSTSELRKMALAWVEGEIARLTVLREELRSTPIDRPVRRRKLHWTQRPENREKLLRMVRKGVKAKNGQKAA